MSDLRDNPRPFRGNNLHYRNNYTGTGIMLRKNRKNRREDKASTGEEAQISDSPSLLDIRADHEWEHFNICMDLSIC